MKRNRKVFLFVLVFILVSCIYSLILSLTTERGNEHNVGVGTYSPNELLFSNESFDALFTLVANDDLLKISDGLVSNYNYIIIDCRESDDGNVGFKFIYNESEMEIDLVELCLNLESQQGTLWINKSFQEVNMEETYFLKEGEGEYGFDDYYYIKRSSEPLIIKGDEK